MEIFTSEEVIAQGFGSWVSAHKQSTTEDSDELLEQYFEILDELSSQISSGLKIPGQVS